VGPSWGKYVIGDLSCLLPLPVSLSLLPDCHDVSNTPALAFAATKFCLEMSSIEMEPVNYGLKLWAKMYLSFLHVVFLGICHSDEQTITQCKCYENSCYAVLFRVYSQVKVLYMFSTDTMFWIFSQRYGTHRYRKPVLLSWEKQHSALDITSYPAQQPCFCWAISSLPPPSHLCRVGDVIRCVIPGTCAYSCNSHALKWILWSHHRLCEVQVSRMVLPEAQWGWHENRGNKAFVLKYY
jgi:hypothetical protein